jgi:hypothetical protein
MGIHQKFKDPRCNLLKKKPSQQKEKCSGEYGLGKVGVIPKME